MGKISERLAGIRDSTAWLGGLVFVLLRWLPHARELASVNPNVRSEAFGVALGCVLFPAVVALIASRVGGRRSYAKSFFWSALAILVLFRW
jgi:hypothetical protein